MDIDLLLNKDLNYTLEGSFSTLFSINTTTGEVFTAASYDRETKSQYTLTVKVTDNGEPPLTDTSSFKIVILDYNDNIPAFTKVSCKFII